jgi:hypothetical protein
VCTLADATRALSRSGAEAYKNKDMLRAVECWTEALALKPNTSCPSLSLLSWGASVCHVGCVVNRPALSYNISVCFIVLKDHKNANLHAKVNVTEEAKTQRCVCRLPWRTGPRLTLRTGAAMVHPPPALQSVCT